MCGIRHSFFLEGGGSDIKQYIGFSFFIPRIFCMVPKSESKRRTRNTGVSDQSLYVSGVC